MCAGSHLTCRCLFGHLRNHWYDFCNPARWQHQLTECDSTTRLDGVSQRSDTCSPIVRRCPVLLWTSFISVHYIFPEWGSYGLILSYLPCLMIDRVLVLLLL